MPVTVGQLIEALQEYPLDAPVWAEYDGGYGRSEIVAVHSMPKWGDPDDAGVWVVVD